MKKIIVSAGLVAISATGIQNAFAAGSDIISPKAWSVSGTLRGFYDDNYAIGTDKKGSFGWEVSPTVSLNLPFRQTDIGFRYIYGLYYYFDRQDLKDPNGKSQPFDQTHQVEFWLDHAFNERWKLNLTDTFAIGQEPELIGPASVSQPNGQLFRIGGDNLANHANVSLDTEWTRLFSTTLRYGNSFFDYQNKGAEAVIDNTALVSTILYPTSTPGFNDGNFRSIIGGASLAGLLNRIEQNIGFDLKWTVQPETVLFLGYNFSLTSYTGNEDIGVFNYVDSFDSITPNSARSLVYRSDSRDSMSHYGYLGASHQFTANISGTARAGASFTDNFNDPLQNSTSIAPYADVSISYTYIPGSYVQLGVTHDLNSTDIASVNSDTGSLTQYQESTVIYSSINHKFTQDLIGTLIGRYQMSTYQGGANDSVSDDAFGLGVNLHYQINKHFSTEVGYNYDNLQSKLQGRSYHRNRVYIGLGANY